MPTYISRAKYTPDALAAVLKDGYASREQAMRAAAESAGGKFIAVYFADPGSGWDFMMVTEFPSSDAGFAMAGIGRASGAFETVETTEVRSAAGADAAAQTSMEWAPPGG